MTLVRPYRLLWHCGWCQPLAKWQLALYAAGIRWTTGICPSCLEHEKRRVAALRASA
jgi:hypothetical protein